MSLYLKYRPQNFETIVGQEHIVTTIKNAIKKNALTHAYLFSGSRGTGKTSSARIIAKALNCLNIQKEYEPCNECENCQSINNGRLVDLIEIDAASNRGIDEIRDLREKILFTPTQGKVKVYIIDEVHMLTKEAFNALLKTLEEPPEHAYFILATTEAHKIPETIISRCQQFNFKRIEINDIIKRLQEIAKEEKIEADEESLKIIARMANGGLRDAIGLFEQMGINGKVEYNTLIKNLGLTGNILIESFYEYLLDKKTSKAIEIINQVNAEGQNLNQFTGDIISFLREKMLISINGNPEETKQIIKLIEIFLEAKEKINGALIVQLPIEIAVIKGCNYAEENNAVSIKGNTIIPVSTDKNGDLNIEEIQNKWENVLNKIETPFIKMSLMNGKPVKYENTTLHMEFKSNTYMDIIQKSTNQPEVIKALESVFDKKMALELTSKTVDLKPVTEEVEVKTEEKKDGASVMDMAKEVFGG